MSLAADGLLDRIKLKTEINKWRSLTILIATILGLVLVNKSVSLTAGSADYIARVAIEGIILEDHTRDEKLAELKDDKHAKAVVVYINSPGGTIVGGETLYRSLRDVAATKPVVAVLGSVAASGGYMAAIAADRIFTHSGTITGSIGVMMQTAEVTELTDKLGVKFITFKSAELKGSPSPFEKLTPKVTEVIDASIKDSYEFFLDLVEQRRPLPRDQLRVLADGRIYTGRQAVANKLVDALGGEQDAVLWLEKEKKIHPKLEVREYPLEEEQEFFEKFYSKVKDDGKNYMASMFGNGMMTMWKPSVM